MIKSKYNVIGVMSGTSLDGIDLAYITFELHEKWVFKIYQAETIFYSDFWRKQLSNLVLQDLQELKKIDLKYTKYLSEIITSFVNRNRINDIDAICSHGHTALHQPDNNITYQIGNHKEIAELTKQTVVCDFRVQDVSLGGQGAPLVPIGDRFLFSEYDFCLNLGGFANISFEDANKRIAFDICSVNIILNHYSRKLGLDYDAGGNLASKGNINSALLIELNALEFYKQNFPKSLGLEWVNSQMIPIIDKYKISIKDILRTLIEHIAVQISSVFQLNPIANVLVSGGGVYNSFLIKRLNAISKNEIIIPSKAIIEYKEALVFGFLGVLKLREEINCLSSVTGASRNHSTGVIHKI